MNRRQRRAAAARARGRRTGYLHRILSADAIERVIAGRRGVYLTTIEHDHGCSIYRGGGCDCVPDIHVSGPDGTVHEIGEDGEITRRSRIS